LPFVLRQRRIAVVGYWSGWAAISYFGAKVALNAGPPAGKLDGNAAFQFPAARRLNGQNPMAGRVKLQSTQAEPAGMR
jgi:hypothetical protein